MEMRVILADSHAKVRLALRLLLEQQPDVEILGEAADTTGLLDWVRAMCPDLVLLDWELPGLAADALLPLLECLCPTLRMIALSVRPDLRQAALDAGADAFVCKCDPPDRLLMAMDEIDVKSN
jgi:DNA-binding NarL/FixJ family response regulator